MGVAYFFVARTDLGGVIKTTGIAAQAATAAHTTTCNYTRPGPSWGYIRGHAAHPVDAGAAATLDRLLRDDLSLLMRGEIVIPIHHALVAAAGTDPARATTVYSHPQALAQCRRRLGELAPDATPVASPSTAAAPHPTVATTRERKARAGMADPWA